MSQGRSSSAASTALLGTSLPFTHILFYIIHSEIACSESVQAVVPDDELTAGFRTRLRQGGGKILFKSAGLRAKEDAQW